MLTGKELGKAIADAIEKKGVTKVEVARIFDVKPPSIQDWIKRGTIAKDKLPLLWDYFRDIAGPEHWGLATLPAKAIREPVPPGPTFSELNTEERHLIDAWRHLLNSDRRTKLKEIVELAQEREAQRQELFEQAGLTGIAERAARVSRQRASTTAKVDEK